MTTPLATLIADLDVQAAAAWKAAGCVCASTIESEGHACQATAHRPFEGWEPPQVVLGYQVAKITADTRESYSPAYVLTGARGARFTLVRSNIPHLMYVKRQSSGAICGLKGNYTFTDKGGRLAVHNG